MTRTISPATFRMLALVAFGSVAGFGEPPDSAQTLRRYLNGQTSACRLDEQAMEIEIEASLPKLKKEGTMQGVKVISASGRVAYRFLRFTGDKLIKTDVIARFLTAEVHPPEHLGNIGTTQENYKFHFLRQANYQGHTAYVFQLRPRKKREGLFKKASCGSAPNPPLRCGRLANWLNRHPSLLSRSPLSGITRNKPCAAHPNTPPSRYRPGLWVTRRWWSGRIPYRTPGGPRWTVRLTGLQIQPAPTAGKVDSQRPERFVLS